MLLTPPCSLLQYAPLGFFSIRVKDAGKYFLLFDGLLQLPHGRENAGIGLSARGVKLFPFGFFQPQALYLLLFQW